MGEALGSVAGTFTRSPLWVGATFAGLDFLLAMLYFAGRTTLAESPWGVGLRRFLVVAVAVFLGHMIYLNVLTVAPQIAKALPDPSPAPEYWTPYPPPPDREAEGRARASRSRSVKSGGAGPRRRPPST
jgi:hypothetical protein